MSETFDLLAVQRKRKQISKVTRTEVLVFSFMANLIRYFTWNQPYAIDLMTDITAIHP